MVVIMPEERRREEREREIQYKSMATNSREFTEKHTLKVFSL